MGSSAWVRTQASEKSQECCSHFSDLQVRSTASCHSCTESRIMALVDSEAAFEQRLREVMPGALARQAVLNGGIRTSVDFCSHQGRLKIHPVMMRFVLSQIQSCHLVMTWPHIAHSADFISKLQRWWWLS